MHCTGVGLRFGRVTSMERYWRWVGSFDRLRWGIVGVGMRGWFGVVVD
jgi:hypothetical protein